MKTVLIIDDASFMRLSLKTMLERNGYKVIGEAENGAVGILKYKELKPDIVTMDITMPELDGIRALKHICNYDPNATVIMITSMGQKTFILEAIKHGAKGFLVKPFKEEHVVETMKKLQI